MANSKPTMRAGAADPTAIGVRSRASKSDSGASASAAASAGSLGRDVTPPTLWDWIVFNVMSFIYSGFPFVNWLFGHKVKLSPAQMDDKTGQVVLVTGANSGTGYETAKAYYEKGAKVYVGCRSAERALAAMEDIKKGGSKDVMGKVSYTAAHGKTGSLEYINIDLADLSTVDKAAAEILAKESRLDVLFANAGIMAIPYGQFTKQGYSLQFGTNVVGHQRLISLLIPLLQRTSLANPASPARLIVTSSAAHAMAPRGGPSDGGIDYAALTRGGKKLSAWGEYGLSKWGNVALAKYVDLKYGPRSGNSKGQILAFSVHPGPVATNLGTHLSYVEALKFSTAVMRATQLTPAEGALSQLYAANLPVPEAEKHTGEYVAVMQTFIPARPDLRHPQAWVKLWDWCEAQATNVA